MNTKVIVYGLPMTTVSATTGLMFDELFFPAPGHAYKRHRADCCFVRRANVVLSGKIAWSRIPLFVIMRTYKHLPDDEREYWDSAVINKAGEHPEGAYRKTHIEALNTVMADYAKHESLVYLRKEAQEVHLFILYMAGLASKYPSTPEVEKNEETFEEFLRDAQKL